jgi:dihydrodipicolinate reductase
MITAPIDWGTKFQNFAIDFTIPKLAAAQIKHTGNIQLPLIMGTTGCNHVRLVAVALEKPKHQ